MKQNIDRKPRFRVFSFPMNPKTLLFPATFLMLASTTHADKILHGVPKVGYGANGVTPFPQCVRACDQFLGGETTKDFIMAASGAAFRLTPNNATPLPRISNPSTTRQKKCSKPPAAGKTASASPTPKSAVKSAS